MTLLAVAALVTIAAGWVADRRHRRPVDVPDRLLWADRRAGRCKRQAITMWLLAVAAAILDRWGIVLAVALGIAGVLYAWEGRRTWASVEKG